MNKKNYALFDIATNHLACEIFTKIYHHQNAEDYIYYFMYVYDESIGKNLVISIGIENENNPEDKKLFYPNSDIGEFLYDQINGCMKTYNLKPEEVKDIFWTSENLQNLFDEANNDFQMCFEDSNVVENEHIKKSGVHPPLSVSTNL